MPGLSIIIVSGLSGSGKSTALRTLEDEGAYCIDNLPGSLILPFVDQCGARSDVTDIAIGLDVRGQKFWGDFDRTLAELAARGHDAGVLFLDASDEALVRRFSENRRPHPLSKDGAILAGIGIERQVTQPIRARARWVIDTTSLNVHQLRQRIVEHLRVDKGHRVHAMAVRVQSFGFKHGIPLDSDLVLDVRFLPNPYFEPALKTLSGLDEGVRVFVLENEETVEFLRRLRELLEYLVPRYARDGKFCTTISVGCTGGRHRSVAIVEALARMVAGARVETFHRDIEKG